MKEALFVSLALVCILFLVMWVQAVLKGKQESKAPLWPTALDLFIGFVTNFFDTLGIGSFATTSSLFKLKHTVPDELIPGTLNVGHCVPTFAEAFIFIAIVNVDVITLTAMIVAAVMGSWLGSGVVSKLPRRVIQISLGGALLAAAILMLMTQLKYFPSGGADLGLNTVKLIAGMIGNFVLGALMTLGIGLFAPCMILVSLLGMDPHAAFPIMMGSCAFLMPVGSARFIASGRYALRPSLGLSIGGLPAVLIAAFWVKSLELNAVRWLVIVVVVYTSTMLLRSAALEAKAKVASEPVGDAT